MFCSRGMRQARPMETETQNQQAIVFQTKGGNTANESTGGVQDLPTLEFLHILLFASSPAPCTEGKTEPQDAHSLVPGSGLVPCNTLHPQSGGWGQLQHKDPKSRANMLI